MNAPGDLWFPFPRPWQTLFAAVPCGIIGALGVVRLSEWASAADFIPANALLAAASAPFLIAVIAALVYTLGFRRGVALSRGRLGVAFAWGRGIRWRDSRSVADVRKLVVRTDGANRGSAIIAVCETGLPLQFEWKQFITTKPAISHEGLMRIAGSLAEALNALARAAPVEVAWERIGFTGERAERPSLSRVVVRESIGALALRISSGWTLTAPQEASPGLALRVGRGWAIVGLATGGLVALASLWGFITHMSGDGHLFSTGVGPWMFHWPSHPDLGIRFLQALAKASVGIALAVPMVAGCLWSLRRTRAAGMRSLWIDRSRSGGGTLELECSNEGLVLRNAGRAIVRWPLTEVAIIAAYRRESTATHEGGSSTTTVYSGLTVRRSDGTELTFTGGAGEEDWEWIATRLRSIAGNLESAPLGSIARI